MPFVTLDVGARDVPTVVVDQQQGARLATQHLLDLGHRQIACVAGPPSWSASKERRKGWAEAIKHAGLEPGPCIEGDWSAASGFAVAGRLLESAAGQFTAIVAANDHMALGILRALHAKDIQVPEHISVVGYDDLPESQFFEPPLTTIHHDFTRQGERCVEALLRLIGTSILDPQAAEVDDEQPAVNTGKEWSDAELNELGNMLVRGLPMEEIAHRLRRDHGEVRDKVAEVGRACR